jgi:hypothetical protein
MMREGRLPEARPRRHTHTGGEAETQRTGHHADVALRSMTVETTSQSPLYHRNQRDPDVEQGRVPGVPARPA